MSDLRISIGGGTGQAKSTPEEARRRLQATFQYGELVWLVGEEYDAHLGLRHLDVLRQSSFGRWTHQRYRFDDAADVLYFLGETLLSDEDFAVARAKGQRFPTA